MAFGRWPGAPLPHERREQAPEATGAGGGRCCSTLLLVLEGLERIPPCDGLQVLFIAAGVRGQRLGGRLLGVHAFEVLYVSREAQKRFDAGLDVHQAGPVDVVPAEEGVLLDVGGLGAQAADRLLAKEATQQ